MATATTRKRRRSGGNGAAEVMKSLTLAAIITRFILMILGALLLLSLVSHAPDDTFALEGGLRDFATVDNWIGVLGAWLSGNLLQWLGFASYVAAIIFLLCSWSRFAGPALSGGAALAYLGAAALITVGSAMLLGIFPEFFGGLADGLNIAQLPGGVLGQKLTAPGPIEHGGGWLALVMNTTGCGIVSSGMILVGLVTLYWYDWHAHVLRRFFSEQEQANDSQKKKPVKEDANAEQTEEERELSAKEKQQQMRQEWREEEERKAREREADRVTKEQQVDGKKKPATPSPAPAAEQPAKGQAKPKAAQPAEKVEEKPAAPLVPFVLPEVKLLSEVKNAAYMSPKEVNEKKKILQTTLESFGLDAIVGDSTCGPRVTLYEIRPAPGIRVERISSLANNFAMNLRAESLRILAPIPGKDSVGIEVPNEVFGPVGFREVLSSSAWKKTKASIPIALGKDIAGRAVILDLADAPHLLIAGATGSGKSVCMNALILSLLYRFKPEELRLVMVDPKVVELNIYNSLPHLIAPVITEVKKVPLALRYAVAQMEWRYKVLAKVGVRNLAAFNSRPKSATPQLDDEGVPIPDKLPVFIVIIDELADIMMTAKADVETSLARIAQLGRAAGIHAVVATQRPSVNVITGIIKANFPTRIAFQVTSVVDSRTIIDGKGAETLLGKGDMLFKARTGKMDRVQGVMVLDDEISRVLERVQSQAPQDFAEDIFSPNALKVDDQALDDLDAHGDAEPAGPSGFVDVGIETMEPDSDDALLMRALQVVMKDRKPSISYVQRSLRIGYNRAAILIEELESRGVIGPQIGNAQRRILAETLEEAVELCKQPRSGN